MDLRFKKISDFDRGILYKLLLDGYSFDDRYRKCFEKSWLEFDNFFFDNLEIADKYGFITVLGDEPIGVISWEPRKRPEYVEVGHNCIASKYKGKGFGKRQLCEAIRRIEKYENLQKIIVSTNSNLIAKHNYESAGFKLTKRRKNEDSAFAGDYLDYEMILERNEKMKEQCLSSKYKVRKLTKDDLDIIYKLCYKNDIFYKYHPPFVTKEIIIEDMEALPPNKEYTDKYYIGYFDDERLVAIMDLILKYPDDKTAFIGLFMMDVNYQKKGIASSIIKECAKYFSKVGFKKIGLGIDKGNPQSKAFWTKNGFVKRDEMPNKNSPYIPMVLSI